MKTDDRKRLAGLIKELRELLLKETQLLESVVDEEAGKETIIPKMSLISDIVKRERDVLDEMGKLIGAQ